MYLISLIRSRGQQLSQLSRCFDKITLDDIIRGADDLVAVRSKPVIIFSPWTESELCSKVLRPGSSTP